MIAWYSTTRIFVTVYNLTIFVWCKIKDCIDFDSFFWAIRKRPFCILVPFMIARSSCSCDCLIFRDNCNFCNKIMAKDSLLFLSSFESKAREWIVVVWSFKLEDLPCMLHLGIFMQQQQALWQANVVSLSTNKLQQNYYGSYWFLGQWSTLELQEFLVLSLRRLRLKSTRSLLLYFNMP